MKLFTFKKFNTTAINDLRIGALGDIVCNQDANEYFFNKNPWPKQILNWAESLDILVITLDGTFPGDNPKKWGPKLVIGENIINLLPRASKTVINLGNNHSFDNGTNGFINLKKYLDQSGFYHVGAGKNSNDAEKPLVLTYDEFTVKIFSATHHGSHPRKPLSDGGQVACLENDTWWDNIKNEDNNINVVLLHGGIQGSHFPSPRAIEISKELIDKSVDAIFWSHAHVIQGLFRYKDKLICYGLGNAFNTFLFGDVLSNNFNKEYDKGILLDISFNNLKIIKTRFSFFKRIGDKIIIDDSIKRMNQLKRYNSKLLNKNYDIWWKLYRLYHDILIKTYKKLFRGNIFKNILSIKLIHFKSIILNIKNTKKDSIDV